MQRRSRSVATVPRRAAQRAAPIESPLLGQAAAALAVNRLTEPAGDNALELYLRAQARDPADPKARAGLAEVRERLLARAENALLEERLDEAAAAIETARKAGVESGRIAFPHARSSPSRANRSEAMQAAAQLHDELKADAGKVTSLLKPSPQSAPTTRTSSSRNATARSSMCGRRCSSIPTAAPRRRRRGRSALRAAGGSAQRHRPRGILRTLPAGWKRPRALR